MTNEGTLHTPLFSEGHISVMNRWSAKHECLWAPQSTRSMQALAMWRPGGVPQRPEWELQPMQFTFSEPPI